MNAIAFIFLALIGVTCVDACRNDEPNRSNHHQGKSRSKKSRSNTSISNSSNKAADETYARRAILIPTLEIQKEEMKKVEEAKEPSEQGEPTRGRDEWRKID
jgi:hypothetical protein